MTCICHLYLHVLLRTTYVYIQCGFIPRVAWKFSNNISSTFRCRKLNSNREDFFSFRCRHRWPFGQVCEGLVCQFLFVCQSVHPSVCLYIHSSVCTFMVCSTYIYTRQLSWTAVPSFMNLLGAVTKGV